MAKKKIEKINFFDDDAADVAVIEQKKSPAETAGDSQKDKNFIDVPFIESVMNEPGNLQGPVSDRAFLWFDDRFYVMTRDEVLKAYDEGCTLHPRIHAAIVSGHEEIRLPSSTTVLSAAPKPWLAEWRGSLGNDEADRKLFEGGLKGKNVHNAVQIWINGGSVIYNNPKKPQFSAEEISAMISECVSAKRECIVLADQQEHLEVFRLTQWFEEIQPVIIATEFTVASLQYGYAGTGDLLCQIKGGTYNINGSKPLIIPPGIYVVDYKTGKVFDKPNHFRQIASYLSAIEESKSYSITGGLIIHTNDNKIKGGIEGLKTYSASREELMTKHFNEFLAIKAVYDIDLDYQPKVIELPAVLTKTY